MTAQETFDVTTKIRKIVFDGGPCGGKTLGIEKVSELLKKRGFIPLVVPEAATILKSGGLHPSEFKDLVYQHRILSTQIHLEKMFEEMGMMLQELHRKPVIMLCDRGMLSGAAYMDSETFLEDFQKKVLDPLGLDAKEVRSRYHGVIHLTTAADGAEEFFTLANNKKARDEKPEDARRLDKRQLSIWQPGSHEVKNRTSDNRPIAFDDKVLIAVRHCFEDILCEPFEE